MTITVQNRISIPRAAVLSRPFPAPPGAGLLPIPYISQSETNWCWAACGEMLFSHYGRVPHTQCDLASSQFGLACCPSPGAPAACDLGCWPDASYPAKGLGTTRVWGSLTSAQLRAELGRGRAVQVCYQWTGGSATHVALIVGEYASGDFEVFDPWPAYGRGARSYSQILGAYGLGSWVLSFTF